LSGADKAVHETSILVLVVVDTLRGEFILVGTVCTRTFVRVLGSDNTLPPLELNACTITLMLAPLSKRYGVTKRELMGTKHLRLDTMIARLPSQRVVFSA
jgi:hypothetical protein